MKRILISLFTIVVMGYANAQEKTVSVDGKPFATALVDSVVCRNPDSDDVCGKLNQDLALKFIQDNLHYPEFAYDNGVHGRVTVSYAINEEGVVTSVTPVSFGRHYATETKSIPEVALEAEMRNRKMSKKKQQRYLQGVRELIAEAVRVTYSFPKNIHQLAMKDGKPVCAELLLQYTFVPYTFRLKK